MRDERQEVRGERGREATGHWAEAGEQRAQRAASSDEQGPTGAAGEGEEVKKQGGGGGGVPRACN
jgi:hypothetical protein